MSGYALVDWNSAWELSDMTHFFAGPQVAHDVALGKKCVICHTLLCDMTQFAWHFLQYI
jgi:hypothetical protein